MRGGIEANLAGNPDRMLIALKDGIDKGTRRAFSLRPRNMNYIETIQIADL